MNYIAVDWGTSNFRAFSVREGLVVNSIQDDCGVAKCKPEQLPEILRQQISRLEESRDKDLPVILCGMIGSNIGIADAGYIELPLSFSELLGKGRVLPGILPNPVTLRPGICDYRVNEICRGEEIQLAGAIALTESSHFAAVGTHSKWMTIDRVKQQVMRLRTLITGELHHLMLNHSVVGKGLPAQQVSHSAFIEGIQQSLSFSAQSTDLVSELFRSRGRYILNKLDKTSVSSWLSGLLIGYEVTQGCSENQTICFIGSSTLLPLYQQACEIIGINCTTLSAESAVIAGLNEVFRHGA